MSIASRWSFRTGLSTCLLVLGASGAQGQGAFQMLDRTDPRVPVAETVVNLLLAGDGAAVEAYLRERALPEYRESPNFSASVVAAMNAVSRPGLQIEDYARGMGDDVLVRLASANARGAAVFVAVGIEPEPPHRVTVLRLPNIMMGPPPGATALERVGAAERQELVDALAEALEDTYVSADTGRIIGSVLRRQLAAGAFDTLTDPQAFAVALTRAMRAVHPDLHLAVMGPALMGRQMAAGTADAERQSNYFMPRAEVLEGNIGYLRLSRLSPQAAALERLGHALTFLQDADALIIDLRGVGGGAGAMAEALVSHFLPPDVPTLSVWSRQTQQTRTTSTLANVAGPRRTDVPLYILVDGGTGSAAEHVPFVLQSQGRATVVGVRTAGAGRNNVMRSLPFGFVASISNTVVRHHATGREWERTGVTPDLPVTADEALEAAAQHARAALGRTTPGN